MTWLIGLICFVLGLLVGAIVYKQLKSDEAKVKTLEEQLAQLQREYGDYKDNVHSHFNNSAQLLNSLTDSYREVYRHIASSAQSLCPDYISEQLTHSAKAQEALTTETFSSEIAATTNQGDEISPPRDYAAKTSPDQKGNLAEDFGLDKVENERQENS